MGQNNLLKFIIIVLIFAITATNKANADHFQSGQSNNSKQSPVLNCDGNSNCTVNYGNERIGKKLAVRSVYLIPSEGFATKTCNSKDLDCKDLYEVFFIFLELQSIWPEPFLLTAASVKIQKPSRNIHMDAGRLGDSILATQITKNSKPSLFIFKPGEIKFIGLSQGIKLDGVLDFFKDNILADKIWEDLVPKINPKSSRVTELNSFLRKHYGNTTSFRIKLFEKNYQPVITTNVQLGHGTDSFGNGDISSSKYQFKHDAFIGEILYQLNGGTVPFINRIKPSDKNN